MWMGGEQVGDRRMMSMEDRYIDEQMVGGRVDGGHRGWRVDGREGIVLVLITRDCLRMVYFFSNDHG